MDSWHRYSQHLVRYPDLGFSLDISQMGFPEGFVDTQRQACERAAHAIGVPALRDATLADLASLPEGVDKQRSHHVVTENARVLETVEALESDDLHRVGELMRESHRSLSVDYEVSSRALDPMAAIANDHPGCFGARMTGGGFGGSAVALIDKAATDEFMEHVRERWQSEHGVVPDLWAVDPSAGASIDRTEG